MQIQIITSWSDFMALEAEWNRLLKASEYDTIFLTHQWFAALIDAYGLSRRLCIVLCRQKRELKGILPLYQPSLKYDPLKWRTLKSITNHHSQKFNFIFKKGCHDLLAKALSWLKAEIGWDMIQLDFVERHTFLFRCEPLLTRYGFEVRRPPAMESQYIALKDDFETYYRNRFSKSLRKKIERLTRKARREHNLEIESLGGAALAADDLLETFVIEDSGWKGRNQTSILKKAADRRFYARLAWTANRQNWFALRFLTFDGRRVAFEYNLRYNYRESSLKAGYDEVFRRYSPGHMLTRFSIQEAYRRGDKIYDLLGPASAYKSKMATDIEPSFKIYLFNSGTKSKLLRLILFETKEALAAMGLKRHLKSILQHRFS